MWYEGIKGIIRIHLIITPRPYRRRVPLCRFHFPSSPGMFKADPALFLPPSYTTVVEVEAYRVGCYPRDEPYFSAGCWYVAAGVGGICMPGWG